jgi:ferredoxin-NADP reductase
VALPADIQVFTCGPLPFMRQARSTLLARGVPSARIRYEVFGPRAATPLAQAMGFQPPPGGMAVGRLVLIEAGKRIFLRCRGVR